MVQQQLYINCEIKIISRTISKTNVAWNLITADLRPKHYFENGRRPPSWISKLSILVKWLPSLSSVCQISSKLAISKWRLSAILDIQNLQFVTCPFRLICLSRQFLVWPILTHLADSRPHCLMSIYHVRRGLSSQNTAKLLQCPLIWTIIIASDRRSEITHNKLIASDPAIVFPAWSKDQVMPCVYNTWPVAALTQAVKPDTGSELRFLPTPPAFDAPVRGVPVGILLCRLARKN